MRQCFALDGPERLCRGVQFTVDVISNMTSARQDADNGGARFGAKLRQVLSQRIVNF